MSANVPWRRSGPDRMSDTGFRLMSLLFKVIDDGQQPRAVTKEQVLASGCWSIVEETADHLKCRPSAS